VEISDGSVLKIGAMEGDSRLGAYYWECCRGGEYEAFVRTSEQRVDRDA
jgi:hypothetical protein